MHIKARNAVTALILIILFILPVNCFASYEESIKNDAVSIVESCTGLFRKPVLEYKPIGLNIRSGLYKNICIGFNSGLHKMSQLETLPYTFENPQKAEVPVLLYHHIIQDTGYGDNVMSAKLFEEHMIAVKEAGYNTVSAKEMIDYVYYGKSLPENPILISFDDGYLSNYELAYPILKKHNMKAIFFAIGWAIGENEYKDTGKPIIEHFSFDHINEMTESGLIEVQSHTYDMHQSPELEKGGTIRESVLMLENENEEEYIALLEKDYRTFDRILFNNTGFRNYAIAYPHGEYSELSEAVFKRLGCYVTFSTEFSNKNILIQGDLESLRALNRFTVSESISAKQLIPLIESVYK